MLENFSTNATVAKIRAIHGKMLTESNYRELIHKKSVSEVAEYLKKTRRYHDALAQVDTNTIHRGYLEELLNRSDFDLYERLCRFQQLDKTDFFQYEIRKQEIEQILECIMLLNAHKSEAFITSLPGFLISHASFDMLELAKAQSFDELVKSLKNTPYFKILQNVALNSDGSINFFRCERGLRTYYYSELLKSVDKNFDGEPATELKQLILNEIDLINIINAYRLKAYFNANSATLKSTMLPFFGKLSKRQMFKLFEIADKDDMLSAFLKTPYGRQISEIDRNFIEDSINRVRFKLKKRALTSAKTAPVALYAFMEICRMETENITNIIEGIRYNVGDTFIEKLLIY